jgi:Flp pilus assembly protein TadG
MHLEKRRSYKQRGYVMVLFALSLAAFLTLAAMAVDLSILYAWRLRVERAAKAAAFSTIQYRSLRGWDYFFDAASSASDKFESDALREEMRAFLRNAVANNLRTSGSYDDARLQIQAGQVGLNSFYDGTTDALNFTVSYQAPTYFIGRLLPLLSDVDPQDFYTVSHSNAASLDPASVALLLDVSGSMNCPNSDCSCRVAGASGITCDSNLATINDLVAALAEFKRFFNPFHDYIAVIPFNLAATKSFAIVSGTAMLPFGSNTARLNSFNTATSRTGLAPQSNTNICDALIQAIDEFRQIDAIEANQAARTRKFTILFTDGAPNALHGVFSPPVTFSNSAASGVSNDWYQYSLEWRTAAGLLYRGPGPLVQPSATSPLFNFTAPSRQLGHKSAVRPSRIQARFSMCSTETPPGAQHRTQEDAWAAILEHPSGQSLSPSPEQMVKPAYQMCRLMPTVATSRASTMLDSPTTALLKQQTGYGPSFNLRYLLLVLVRVAQIAMTHLKMSIIRSCERIIFSIAWRRMQISSPM